MYKILKNTVQIAHEYLEKRLKSGNVAVDATVGNGKDTLVLARLVGKAGRVYGFDIQDKAIQTAQSLLSEEGFSGNVRLFCTGHEHMLDFVKESVDAIVFNLGYLPGGDHNIVTRPSTTVEAVNAGLKILNPGGIICIVVYTGHPGGLEEETLLESVLSSVDKKQFCVGKISFLNRHNAPYLLIIEKNC